MLRPGGIEVGSCLLARIAESSQRTKLLFTVRTCESRTLICRRFCLLALTAVKKWILHTGATGGNIIILNGTCGSGKSTVAEILLRRGLLAIDGDCVIQVVKHREGTLQVDFNEMAVETAREIDILSMFGNDFVLSTVILLEDLDKYIAIFQSRNLKYRLFLLKPEYQTAVARCQSRTCHGSITPEYWIRYFYKQLDFDDSVNVVDNTNMTPEETADLILNKSRAANTGA